MNLIQRIGLTGATLAVGMAAMILPATAGAQNLRTLYDFPVSAGDPIAVPVQASDGNIYFAVGGGVTGLGQVLKMPIGGGPVTNLYSFADGTKGTRLAAGLIQGNDGNLYGVAQGGGAYGYGTVFQLTLSGNITVIYNFTGGSDGASPIASLLQASDGNLYGITYEDKITESTVPAGYPPIAGGTVFEISPGPGGVFSPVGAGGSTFTKVYNFSENWTYGLAYQAPLIEGQDGNIYGVSYAGGSQIYAPSTYGFIFSFPKGGASFNIVYQFLAGSNDGAGPLSLMQASDGNLYGTNWYCPGTSGTVWQYNLSGGTLTTLYGFPTTGNEISAPTSLVERSDGFLYGTAQYGNLMSTIFKMAVGGGAVIPVYSFTGGADGGLVYEGMLLGTDGNLYGNTMFGGPNNTGLDTGDGTIFEYGFDTTPPTITATPSQSMLWPPNGKTIPVTVTGTFSDSGSGINSSSLSYSVVDSYGQIQPSGSVTVASNGSFSFTVNLVASRQGSDKNGRTYTITITGKDNVGNVGTRTVTVTVPHNQ